MPLSLQTKSRNSKIGPHVSCTTRAGGGDMYGTCPSTCPLKPPDKGTHTLDSSYARKLSKAVPKGGLAWAYTHFDWRYWFKDFGFNTEGRTVMNYSASHINKAINAMDKGIPTVFNLPSEGTPSGHVKLGDHYFFWCPAETHEDKNCSNCNLNGRPICAQPDRKVGVLFKNKKWKKNPCYAANGFVVREWKKTMQILSNLTDGMRLSHWIKSLPYGSWVRHHIAGDMGKDY